MIWRFGSALRCRRRPSNCTSPSPAARCSRVSWDEVLQRPSALSAVFRIIWSLSLISSCMYWRMETSENMCQSIWRELGESPRKMKRSGLRCAVKSAAVRICSLSAFVQIGLNFHSAGEGSFLRNQKMVEPATRAAKTLKAPRNQRVFFLKVVCIISRGTAKSHDAGIRNFGQ